MDEEKRAKEIGETAEETSQRGVGRYIVLFLIYLIGIVASIIYWIVSIVLWLGAWLVAWVGFILIFCVMWVVNLFRPMPEEWGYRYVKQEDWFLTSDELAQKCGEAEK
jgi:hypothetical protein